MDAKEAIDRCETGLAAIFQGLSEATGSPQQVPYEMKHVVRCARALFTFSPLQVGDKAELVNPPEISHTESWGYMGAKHLFVKGSRVDIVSLDWHSEGAFMVGFTFEYETWIDHQGITRKVDRPAIYTLGAHRFTKVEGPSK